MRDKDELRSVGVSSYKVRETRDVYVIKSSLDLVEDNERRRPELQDGEKKADSGKASLSSGKERQSLQFLSRRLGLNVDVAAQYVGLVIEDYLRGTASEQISKELLEVLVDSHEMFGEFLLHAFSQFGDDVLKILLGRLDVVPLTGHEVKTLGKLPVFLKCVEVYRSEVPYRILQRSDALALFTGLFNRRDAVFYVVICDGVVFPELVLVSVYLVDLLIIFCNVGAELLLKAVDQRACLSEPVAKRRHFSRKLAPLLVELGDLFLADLL